MKPILFDAEGLSRRARGAALVVACLLAPSVAFAAAAPHACPAGSPIATFRLSARPIGGGSALPLSTLNVITPGETLVYDPVGDAFKGNRRAEIGLVLVAADGSPEILSAKPAAGHAEWIVPVRSSAVGVVLGPRGIDEKKLAAVLRKDPSAVDRLADYADQTSKVEALVQTLSKYEQSSPDTGNSLQSVLNGFSSQYGVSLPPIDRSKPADQQAAALLRAVTPALAVDPAARPSLMQQSGGLAAAVAALFFGPPAGLALSGVALVGSLHTSLLPPTDFRSAFSESTSSGTALCTGGEQPPGGTRLEFVWMLRLPDTAMPEACGIDPAHVPAGWTSTLTLRCARVAHLKALPHAHDWRLAANGHEVVVPATVTVGDAADTLAIDLTKAAVRPGEYQLATMWDWTPLAIAGSVDVRPFSDLSTVAATPASEDRIVAGGGAVDIELTGADFEFVDRATTTPAATVTFTLPKGKDGGEQRSAIATLDTSALKPGRVVLHLAQANGKAHDITLPVHPAVPALTGLPVMVNVGEAKQVVDLHGTALERVAKITSAAGTWTLKPLPPGAHDVTERQAEVHIEAGARAGDRFPVELAVSDLHHSLEIADALEVIGPRPKIVAAKASIPGGSGVQLRDRELPAGVPASFAIETDHAGPHPAIRLACEEGVGSNLALQLGEKNGSARLDAIGSDSLYLAFDPGRVGPSGCSLTANVIDPATGTSEPYALGRVVRLPRIETFAIGTEALHDSVYAGTLVGEDLETIEKTGWNATSGAAVQGIPTPVPGSPGKQTLTIAVPWPPPSPHAPLYIWLRGEREGRRTDTKY